MFKTDVPSLHIDFILSLNDYNIKKVVDEILFVVK